MARSEIHDIGIALGALALASIAVLGGGSLGCGTAAKSAPGRSTVIQAGDEAAARAQRGLQIRGSLPSSVEPAVRSAIAAADSGDISQSGWSAPLAEAGYLRASLCPDGPGRWVLDAGAPIDSVRWVWVGSPGWEGDLPPRAFARREGGDLSDQIEVTVAQVLRDWDQRGHPLASVKLVGFSVDQGLTLEARLEAGPAVTVTDLRFSGARVTRTSFLHRVCGWSGAEPYAGDRWRETRELLLATGLFDSVSDPLILMPPGPQVAADDAADPIAASGASVGALPAAAERSPAAADSLGLPLLFRLRERQVNQVQGVLGYSGQSETLSGFVDLVLGNLFGTGRAARLFWQRYGEEHSLFEFDWHEPFLWRLPVACDLSLHHQVEDTLYAQTIWGATLGWRPTPRWQVDVGWDWERVVLAGAIAGTVRRTTARFGVERRLPDREQHRRGWELAAQVKRTSGDRATLRRLDAGAGQWIRGRRWGVWLSQAGGLIAGTDRHLRGDAYQVGGVASLRGYFEGEWRALRYGLVRTEVGPRLDARGSRVYLLGDAGWLEEWRAGDDGVYGARGGEEFLWSLGVGMRLPTRAGAVRWEYAVPAGRGIWSGRLHFGLESRF